MQGSSGVGVHFRVGLGRSNHREVFGLASSTVHVTCMESPTVQLPDTSVLYSGRSHALFFAGLCEYSGRVTHDQIMHDARATPRKRDDLQGAAILHIRRH